MARRLPSLNGLRAFEAAGRHGSFTAAANELNVTQTAVSRMVRLLERRLGFALFLRHANALELTAQGQSIPLAGLDRFKLRFDRPSRRASSGDAVRSGADRRRRADPLAMNWLIPRLTSFYRSHPEGRSPHGDRWRDAPGPRRLDLHHFRPRCAGSLAMLHTAEELFPSTLVPVCTFPELARPVCARQPADLHKATLIIVPHLANDWPIWFRSSGLARAVAASAPKFSSTTMPWPCKPFSPASG